MSEKEKEKEKELTIIPAFSKFIGDDLNFENLSPEILDCLNPRNKKSFFDEYKNKFRTMSWKEKTQTITDIENIIKNIPSKLLESLEMDIKHLGEINSHFSDEFSAIADNSTMQDDAIYDFRDKRSGLSGSFNRFFKRDEELAQDIVYYSKSMEKNATKIGKYSRKYYSGTKIFMDKSQMGIYLQKYFFDLYIELKNSFRIMSLTHPFSFFMAYKFKQRNVFVKWFRKL